MDKKCKYFFMNILSRYKGHYKICYSSYIVTQNFKNNFVNTVD